MAAQTLWGYVSREGKVLSGTGFTVALQNEGIFNLSFDQPFTGRPAVVATQVYYHQGNGGDTRDGAVIVEIQKDKVRVKTGDSPGRGVHRDFSFIAMGY